MVLKRYGLSKPVLSPALLFVTGCSRAVSTNAVFVPGRVTSNNPSVRPLGDTFFNDTTHGYQQRAAFASVDWDLVPRSLTLTTGTRYFSSIASEVGSTVGSEGCSLLYSSVPNPCVNRGATDLNALGLERTYSGFRSRASLSWKVSDVAMLYATWSQGFRPGGFNRGFQIALNSPLAVGDAPYQAQASAHKGFTLPLAYSPDTLSNTELGWRTKWLAGRLHWNGTLYQEDWTDAQVSAAGPEFGGTGEAVNGGTYRVRGLETSAGLEITDGFTVDANVAWNHGRLVKEATYYWNDGTPINFETLRFANRTNVANFGGALGSPLSGAPSLQATIRARYEIEFDAVRANFQLGAMHQAHSLASATNASVDAQGKAAVYNLAPFSTFEAAVGIAKDAWSVQAYGENLSDTRAQLYADYYNFVKTVTTNRPRTFGLRVSCKFAGD